MYLLIFLLTHATVSYNADYDSVKRDNTKIFVDEQIKKYCLHKNEDSQLERIQDNILKFIDEEYSCKF